MLQDYPRQMIRGPNVNLVAGQLVACSEGSCDTFDGGEWNHLVDFLDPGRIFASNAVNDDRMLLIGGAAANKNTTEWIPVDGSPAQPGPFNGNLHLHSQCTIQTAPDRIVVTGGAREIGIRYTYDYVAEYQLTGDFTETALTPMLQGRIGHACGVYQRVGGQQVRRVPIENTVLTSFNLGDDFGKRIKCIKTIRYALKKKLRYYLGIFPPK